MVGILCFSLLTYESWYLERDFTYIMRNSNKTHNLGDFLSNEAKHMSALSHASHARQYFEALPDEDVAIFPQHQSFDRFVQLPFELRSKIWYGITAFNFSALYKEKSSNWEALKMRSQSSEDSSPSIILTIE